MTLPGFDYPDQSAWGWAPGVWQERTARRILNHQDQEMEPLPSYLADTLNLEHDDLMDANAYDRRDAERDGWQTAHWDGRW